ncbi:MAG: hypothetical protein Q8L78_00795 [Coxiellaceae bacterium]|nr:hypothetical protein [Coxiellaceae bacterium]
MRPFVLTENDIQHFTVHAAKAVFLTNNERANRYRAFNIDRRDGSGFCLHLEIILPDGETYYVPFCCNVPDRGLFQLKARGNFNAVYFPYCADTMQFIPNPEVVFRVPFSQTEQTETVERTVRLWNELYQLLFPHHPELATASPCGAGALLPYISYARDANPFEIIQLQWAIFAMSRVYLDAIVPGNIVVADNGETLLLDPGNVIKFSGPEDLEKSQISLEAVPCMLGRYISFLERYINNKEYTEEYKTVAVFTLALIALGALNLTLKPDVDLSKRNADGSFFYENLIIALANLSLSKEKIVVLPESHCFLPEAADNLASRNAVIKRFSATYQLSSEEINVLRLNPFVSLYEAPLKNLSYLDIRFRRDILFTYSLLDERFFHVAAFLLLSPKIASIVDGDSFDRYYKAYCNDQRISNRYFRALKMLSEKSNGKNAFLALRGLSENHAEFLARGYAYGLRKGHLPFVLSEKKERQDKIIAVLSNQGLIARDISTVLLATDAQLDAMTLRRPTSMEMFSFPRPSAPNEPFKSVDFQESYERSLRK